MSVSPLTSISPLDGRYRRIVAKLAPTMSEYGLIRFRVIVECAYLMALAQEKEVSFTLTDAEETILQRIAGITEQDALLVKQIETEGVEGVPATRHDVKAVEYYIKQRFRGTTLEDKAEWVHFGLTSEDVNNVAYALMLREGTGILAVTLDTIIGKLDTLAVAHADLPMLARTHGQSASPTTFGKEVRVFVERLRRERKKLESFEILAKLNGATGNYHTFATALPKTDWVKFSQKFIESLNEKKGMQIVPNLYTTQIEPHDSYAELFHLISRVNTILIGFDQDMWRYISDGWIAQKPKAGEVGSSTMPHKVNPIDFENSEGNFGIANALLGHLASKLPVSRLQRDLTDSTTARNFGVAFGHTLIGYESLLTGLSRIEPNEKVMKEALEAHPEVLAEAIQTVLRREGQAGAYETLKELTRGRAVSIEDLRSFVKGLIIPEETKMELLALTPSTYLGYASKLAKGKN